MRKLNYFLGLVAVSAMVVSCGGKQENPYFPNPTKTEDILPDLQKDLFNARYVEVSEITEDGLIRVSKKTSEGKTLYGFINEKGKEVIALSYDAASDFHNGYASVMTGTTAGAIDVKGKTVVPMNYSSVSLFEDGLAVVGATQKTDNGEVTKYGFVNEKGKEVIAPQYEYADVFSDGLALVVNADRKGGFINKKGKQVIDFKYIDATKFVNGLAFVKEGKEDNPTVKIINKKGEDVCVCGSYTVDAFREPDGNFINGLARVKNKDNKYGYINEKGEIVITCQFDAATAFKYDGKKAIVKTGDIVKVIDTKGKEVK